MTQCAIIFTDYVSGRLNNAGGGEESGVEWSGVEIRGQKKTSGNTLSGFGS